VQVSVAAVASNDAAVREGEILRVVRSSEAALQGGRDTLVITSRKLVTGESKGLENRSLIVQYERGSFCVTRFIEKRSCNGSPNLFWHSLFQLGDPTWLNTDPCSCALCAAFLAGSGPCLL
jgi:hypothetical protein